MKIISTGSKRFENKKLYYIHWDVTRNCNFKCEYCCTYTEEPIIKFDKIKIIIEFFNYIKEKHNKDIVLSLFGGEPTLHPHFCQIIENLGSYEEIQIQTNLSKPISWWETVSNIRKDMVIIPSYHYNKIDESEFISKIIFLCDKFKHVKVKVMWESDYKGVILRTYNILKKLTMGINNLSVSLDMVYWKNQNFNQSDFNFYLEQQTDKSFYLEYDNHEGIKYKDVSYNEVKAFHKGDVNFHFYRCHAGLKGIFVTYDGVVYSCQSMRNYNYGSLFDIFIDGFKPINKHITKSIVCPIDQTCYEIVIPKERILKRDF